jgi:hypothetical protein
MKLTRLVKRRWVIQFCILTHLVRVTNMEPCCVRFLNQNCDIQHVLLGFLCTLINWLASELLGHAIGRMLCAMGFKPWPYPAPAPALACLLWRDGTAGSQLLAMCWTKYHRLYLSVTAQAQEITSSHDGCNGSTWEGHSYIAYITYLRKEFSRQQVPSTRSMKTKIWWYTPPHNHQNDRRLKMAMIFNHVLEILFPSPRSTVLIRCKWFMGGKRFNAGAARSHSSTQDTYNKIEVHNSSMTWSTTTQSDTHPPTRDMQSD